MASLDLSWSDNSDNENGFEIFRGTSSGSLSSIDTVSAGTTSYTDTGLLDGEKYYYRVEAYTEHTSSSSQESSGTTDLPAPTGVSATVQANDQIDVSWNDTIDNGEYHIQLLRDGISWTDPSGGSTRVGHNTTSASYGPNSDNSYESQVGIDSRFKFRIRAETEHTSSSWDYSGSVYTDPIPPHNPSVSRPDANTIELSTTVKSDIADELIIDYREDTGNGYDSWSWLESADGSESFVTGDPSITGDTVTITLETGTSYQGGSLSTDSRYQFHISSYYRPATVESEYVYADYGNDGNVYFEDDFESNDLSAWRNTPGAYTSSGAGMDSGFSGADQGTYYAILDGDSKIDVQLPDLSNESDVIVKAAVAVGSADSPSEELAVDFWDGSNWKQLTDFHHEYNKQGWVEMTALVPDSYLGGGDYIRFESESGGGGDHYYVDRVVVSDILHEFTKPADPSNLSIDTSVEHEFTASWTTNASFLYSNDHDYREVGAPSWTDDGWYAADEVTVTGLLDGEQYEFRVKSKVRQFRHGNNTGYWDSNFVTSPSGTTVLPAPTNTTVSDVAETSIDISWQDNANNESGQYVYYREDGTSTWTQDSDVGANTTAATVSGLAAETRYEFYVESYTPHTSTDSTTTDAVSTAFVRSISTDVTPDSNTSRGGISFGERATTSDVTPDSTATRDVTKPRSTIASTTPDSAVSRTVKKSRTTTVTGDGEITSMQALLEVFPDEESLDVQWDFNDEFMGFATEWLAESSIIDATIRDGIGVTFNGDLDNDITVWVQYDISGDGTADVTSKPQTLYNTYQTITFDDSSLFGQDGYYRVIIRGLRNDDVVNQVDLGAVHPNL